jgi:uncharacterized repeat protein (TIGR01451 family)
MDRFSFLTGRCGGAIRFATWAVALATTLHVTSAAGPVGPPVVERRVASRTTPTGRSVQAVAPRPLAFSPVAGDAVFDARGFGYGVAITASGTRLTLMGEDGPRVVDLRVIGATGKAALRGVDPHPGVVHRLVGPRERWSLNGASFAKVRVTAVRPGLDLVYYGTEGQLEYDFVVAPGTDPAAAALEIEGADRVEIEPGGDLLLHVGERVLRQRSPIAYQEHAGGRDRVAAAFTYDAATRRLGFDLGEYDHGRPLVIDPVLVYSSWFGSVSDESFADIAVDASGFIYVFGTSAGSGAYPTTAGTAFPAKPGPALTSDYVVTKLNPAGSAVVWSTYIGGSGNDMLSTSFFTLPAAIAVDSTGQVHVTGETASADFPTTASANDSTYGGGVTDAFYTKLAADGTLAYSTYHGGSGTDAGFGIAVDAAGAAYLTGGTQSTAASGFPVTGNAYRGTLSGTRDVFVARYANSGTLTYASYFGGTNYEASFAGDIVVDGVGRITFGSDTSSAVLPVTASARQSTYGGGSADAFIARIDTNVAGLAGLLYATYHGGSGQESLFGLTADASGRIYITGNTQSANFPTTAGAYDTSFNTGGFAEDGYVAKFDTTLSGASSLIYSTFLGGNDRESMYDVGVDAQGRAHVVGGSRATDFPLVAPIDSVPFLTEQTVSILDPSGSTLTFSTWLGSECNGKALVAVAMNAAGEAYLAGYNNDVRAQSATFPKAFPLVNAIQTSYGGGNNDGVIQKLGFAIDLSLTKQASAGVVLPGQNVTFTLTVTNPSTDAASGVVVSDTLPAGLEFVSCVASHGGICAGSGQGRSASFATLGPGVTATVTLVVKMVAVTPGQQILNSATVVAGVLDPVAANNTGTATVSVPTLEPTADADGDGLPNGFESKFGLDPFGGAGSGANDDPDGDGKTNLQELAEGSHPRGFVITYLAEGATGAFFDTRLAIANPTGNPALVQTRFQRADGTAVTDYRVVAPMSRATIDIEGLSGLEAAEFSTLVEADVQVVADRTMTWDGSGYGSHAERGILTRTATKWYFAEGATFGPFNLFYLIQNPNAQTANVTVTYLLPSGAPLTKQYTVGPQSRFNIWVDSEGATDPSLAALASAELSAVIESTNGVPIIAERAMYLDQPGRPLGAGHESAGVTAPATQWFLAEGATGAYFDLFLLVANPNPQKAEIQVDYLLASGQVLTKQYSVNGNSRFNIWVDLEDPLLADAAVSSRVVSTNAVPIIVERAMWWPGPTSNTWQEAHNSPGETTTGTRWAMAEGESGGARETETYVLIANVSSAAGTVRATVLFEDGSASVSRDFPIGANSRTNIAPASDFPEAVGKRYGMLLESVGGAPVQIVVERAMYSNSNGVRWAAGTNALATRLP